MRLKWRLIFQTKKITVQELGGAEAALPRPYCCNHWITAAKVPASGFAGGMTYGTAGAFGETAPCISKRVTSGGGGGAALVLSMLRPGRQASEQKKNLQDVCQKKPKNIIIQKAQTPSMAAGFAIPAGGA